MMKTISAFNYNNFSNVEAAIRFYIKPLEEACTLIQQAKKERNEKSVSGRNEEKHINHKKRKADGDISNKRSFAQSKVSFGEFLKPTHVLNSDCGELTHILR
jgi:hypothetical protein